VENGKWDYTQWTASWLWPISKAVLYHDFAQDVVYHVLHQTEISKMERNDVPWSQIPKQPYGFINLTPYLWNEDVKEKIRKVVKEYSSLAWRYIPWEADVDDYFLDELRVLVPTISVLDWTTMSIDSIVQWFDGAEYGVAMRLHLCLLCRRLDVPFLPIAYQEKVTKMLAESKPLKTRHPLPVVV
jgi:polysaccharide pyruvyl transferase WcaK-like protein